MKTTRNAPGHEEITARAQQLWRIAGNPVGRDLEFWLAAENEVKHERMETSLAADASPRADVPARPGSAEMPEAKLPAAPRRRSR